MRNSVECEVMRECLNIGCKVWVERKMVEWCGIGWFIVGGCGVLDWYFYELNMVW